MHRRSSRHTTSTVPFDHGQYASVKMMSGIRLLLEQAHYLVLEVCSAVRHPLFGDSVVGEPVDEDVGDRFSGCVLGWREPDITTVVVLQYEDVEVVVFSW